MKRKKIVLLVLAVTTVALVVGVAVSVSLDSLRIPMSGEIVP